MPSCGARPCVCLSVCPSRSYILSKRIKISSKFFHRRVATPFWYFHTKRNGDIPAGTPLTGASNAGGVGRNRDSEPISGFTVLLVRCRRTDNTWPAATGQVLSIGHRRTITVREVMIAGETRNVYDKKPQRYAKDNRTAHLTVHSDKSVAFVTNNKRLYSTFCNVEANY